MLKTIVDETWLKPKGVVGIFPANAVGDDIEIYADEARSGVLYTQTTLRQQSKKAAGQPNIALADFMAPKELGISDYLGAFVVTSGNEADPILAAFEKNHDDYNVILLKALADRLAEAFAEYLHREVRINLWGYEQNESLSNEELIQEKYRGIRPAPGYPACPDHLEKTGIFQLLDAENAVGVTLTESLAMLPVASVSGWYFAHPDAKYFGLGKINEEQLLDVSNRKKCDLEWLKKWFSPFLTD